MINKKIVDAYAKYVDALNEYEDALVKNAPKIPFKKGEVINCEYGECKINFIHYRPYDHYEKKYNGFVISVSIPKEKQEAGFGKANAYISSPEKCQEVLANHK